MKYRVYLFIGSDKRLLYEGSDYGRAEDVYTALNVMAAYVAPRRKSQKIIWKLHDVESQTDLRMNTFMGYVYRG